MERLTDARGMKDGSPDRRQSRVRPDERLSVAPVLSGSPADKWRKHNVDVRQVRQSIDDFPPEVREAMLAEHGEGERPDRNAPGENDR